MKKKKFKIGFRGALVLHFLFLYISFCFIKIENVATILLVLHFFGSVIILAWDENKEKENNELWHSSATKDHVFYRYLYDGEDCNYLGKQSDYISNHCFFAPEDFLGHFSYEAIKKYLKRDLSAAMFCSAFDRQNGVVTESFVSLCMYRSYIEKRCELYNNREVVLYCFVLPGNILSALPMIYHNDTYQPMYNMFSFFGEPVNLQETLPEIFRDRENEFSCIEDISSYPYGFGFFTMYHDAPSDEYQSLVSRTGLPYPSFSQLLSKTRWDNIFFPPFAKVTGKLCLSDEHMSITDCHFETASYSQYLISVDEKIDNILKKHPNKKRKERHNGN